MDYLDFDDNGIRDPTLELMESVAKRLDFSEEN